MAFSHLPKQHHASQWEICWAVLWLMDIQICVECVVVKQGWGGNLFYYLFLFENPGKINIKYLFVDHAEIQVFEIK